MPFFKLIIMLNLNARNFHFISACPFLKTLYIKKSFLKAMLEVLKRKII